MPLETKRCHRIFQFAKPLKNERGDIFLVALITVALSLVSSIVIMNYTQQVEVNSKKPRMKSMMTSIEAKVRTALLSPASYTNCVSSSTSDVRAACRLNIARIQALGMNLASGSSCPPPKTTCGINVTVLSDPTSSGIIETTNTTGQAVSRVQVRIRYEVVDINLADINVVMDIPADILQEKGVFACPENAPKFRGFGPDGRMICQALPGRLGPSQFIGSINIYQVTTNPVTLPPSADCSTNDQFISNVAWGLGGTNFDHSCTNRLDPFTTFGFTPKPAPAGDVVYTTNPIQ